MAELTTHQLEDKQFIQSGDWSYPDVVPLRRMVENDTECGFITSINTCQVYLENMFTFSNGDMSFADLDSVEYDSIDELLGDGWYVD